MYKVLFRIGLICLVVFLLWGSKYASTHIIFPEKLGDMRIRGLTKQALVGAINSYRDSSNVVLILPDQKYVTSLTKLGLIFDVEDFWKNRFVWWVEKVRFQMSLDDGELLVKAKSKNEIKPVFNQDSGMVELSGTLRNYVVDLSSISDDVNELFGNKELVIVPEYVEARGVLDEVEKINESLSYLYKDPIILKVKDGGYWTDFTIDKEIILRSLQTEKMMTYQAPKLNKEVVMSFVVPKLTERERRYFDEDLAYENISKEVNLRYLNHQKQEAVLGIDDGPTTDGMLADKYMEVDISQQKMYFFDKGKLYKTYAVSTGDYYPTPVGRYNIFAKSPMAFSHIYDVWMPYWMAFKYADDIGAYLGIHELPYKKDGMGNPIYRFGFYIGDKKTGGCVALAPKEAKEVYEMSPEGMLVNIVP